jgi:protein-tyrosine-phosphatase
MNIKNVLYLCTQNSARSIIAEAITNYKYSESLKGFSAGSAPSGVINPKTLDLLNEMKIPTEKLHSKSWDVFHFNIEDPVKQNLNEEEHKKFFRSTFDYIDQLIKENLLK